MNVHCEIVEAQCHHNHRRHYHHHQCCHQTITLSGLAWPSAWCSTDEYHSFYLEVKHFGAKASVSLFRYHLVALSNVDWVS